MELAKCLHSLGMMYVDGGRKKKAIEMLEAAVKIYEQNGIQESGCKAALKKLLGK